MKYFLFALIFVAAAAHAQCVSAQLTDVQFEAQSFPVQRIGNAIFFRAGMYIDADGAPDAYGPQDKGVDFIANAKSGDRFTSVALRPDGQPVVQRSGRFRGYYVSTTSLRKRGGNPAAPGTYVNARKVPYFVLPPEFMRQLGISLGDLAVVTNQRNGKSAFAIFADVGPRGQVGEGSMALARALGLNDNPRYGGTGAPSITYLVFPRSGLGQGRLRSAREIRNSTAKVFRRWGGGRRLDACSNVRIEHAASPARAIP